MITSLTRIHRRFYKALFFGSDSFSLKSLARLNLEHKNNRSLIEKLEIVTFKETAKDPSLKNQVAKYAVDNNLRLHQVDKDETNWNIPRDFDLGVVVSFGAMIPENLIQSFRKGTLNVHPSLLPKYRGGAPIHHAILNGDTETGVSIIELSPDKFDSGKILKQEKVGIPPRQFFDDLHESLSDLGAKMLMDVISDLDRYKSSAQPQVGKVSLARKLSKDHNTIHFTSMTSEDIYRLHRVHGNHSPLQTTFMDKHVLLRYFDDPSTNPSPTSLKDSSEFIPGNVYFEKPFDRLWIKCKDSWISCTKIKISGKKEIGPKDLVNGYQLKALTTKYFD